MLTLKKLIRYLNYVFTLKASTKIGRHENRHSDIVGIMGH